MRIWRIAPSPSNKDELLWLDSVGWKEKPSFRAKPVEDTSKLREFRVKRILKKDLIWLDRSVFALSEKAYECLNGLLHPFVQSIETHTSSGELWLINVLARIDCSGPNSIIEYGSCRKDGSPDIKLISVFDFKLEDVRNCCIFKIVGAESAFCYCNDQLVDAVIDNELEGFRFYLVWDSARCSPPIRFERILDLGEFYIDSGKKTKACLPENGPSAFIQNSHPSGMPSSQVAAYRYSNSISGSSEIAGQDVGSSLLGSKAKTRPAASYDGPPLDADILEARAAALASMPDLPALGGALADGPCAPLGSRVGGEPGMLPGEEWPLGPGGEPLCFLAQLDMADLLALPGFPRQGLLRLFVGPEPEYGLDPGDMAAQRGFRALFAPDPSGAALRPAPDEEAEDGLDWGEGPWAIRFGASGRERPEDFDFRVQEAFSREWVGAHPGLPASSVRDAGRYASDKSIDLALAIEAEEGEGDPPAVQVGGYPRFVQPDDRRAWEERYRRYDALLLQLSSDPGKWINIGDGGRMYFFIPSANLAAGDFSDIMYWWDGM